jgi:predicted phage-related endonuclease
MTDIAKAWKFPRGIAVHRPADRVEWLSMREYAVTASDAGALLGVHDYTTAYELWARKMGLLPPMAQDDPVLVRGELLEDDALELFRRSRPEWRIVANIIGQDGLFLEDPVYRLGATPDAFCVDPDHVPGIIEIKTTDHATFRDKWGGPDDPQPPLWIAVQATLTGYLAGARRAHIAVMCVGRTLDLHVVSLDINFRVVQRLQAAAKAFWRAVDTDVPPDPDFERDGEAIKALLPHERGTSIDLSGDNEVIVAIGTKLALDRQIAELEAAQGRCEALLRHKIGEHAIALIDGKVAVTNKLIKRKPYAVGPGEYRKLVVIKQEAEHGTDHLPR